MRHSCFSVVTCALLCLTSASASTFNAVTDFSSTNPSGTWSYGQGTVGSSFSPFTVFTSPCAGGGFAGTSCWQSVAGDSTPEVALNYSGSPLNVGTVVIPSGVLLTHPGPSTDVIVEWTAPAAGMYSISGFFELLDVFPTGVVTSIYDGSSPLFAATLTGPGAMHPNTVGELQSFSLTKTLAAGSIISFGINNDGNYTYDSTGFDSTISSINTPTSTPEPASLLLLIAGIVGILLTSRNFRYRLFGRN